MKKLLVVLGIVVLLCFGGVTFAGSMHQVKLHEAEVFMVPEEFPQTTEKGNFSFQEIFTVKINGYEISFVNGNSLVDPSFSVFYMATMINGKIHVVANGTIQSVYGKDVNEKHYRDFEFFKTGIPSGILNPAKDLPLPEDWEALPKHLKGTKF